MFITTTFETLLYNTFFLHPYPQYCSFSLYLFRFWDWGRGLNPGDDLNHPYFSQSVGSAVRPQRLLSCSGGSADFLHRHIWLTCHTSCSWVPVSWHCSSPPLTVTTPHPSEGSLKEIFWIKQNICLWDCWPTPSLSEIKAVASGRMTHWANSAKTERGARSRDQVQSLQEVCFHKCVHTQSKKRSWLNVKWQWC